MSHLFYCMWTYNVYYHVPLLRHLMNQGIPDFPKYAQPDTMTLITLS